MQSESMNGIADGAASSRPALQVAWLVYSLVAVVLGALTAVWMPVWMGDSAPLLGGLMIGLGTTSLAAGTFVGAVRFDRSRRPGDRTR